MKQTCETIEVLDSTGNVFADLGLKNADERLAKADIAINIRRAVKERGLTQKQVAELWKIDQPSVSKLLRGQLKGFTTDRLFKFLTALDQDVMITIRPATRVQDREHAHGRVYVAAP